MPSPLVVVISGPPASGKTTLGARLAAELALPFLSRDGLKETLFDALGWRDRDWSRQLGGASWELLWHVMDVLAAGRASFVVESNFHADLAGARMRQLQRQHGFAAVQIVCATDDATLLRRFRVRALDGARHPGHVDEHNQAEIAALLQQRPDYRLGLTGHTLVVDTTDGVVVDVRELAAAVRDGRPRPSS